MANKNLEKELEFFKKNQEKLVERHKGKYLVIKDQRIQSVHDSETEAYNDAQKQFELGTFLIQQALPGEQSYTQTFHSRVVVY